MAYLALIEGDSHLNVFCTGDERQQLSHLCGWTTLNRQLRHRVIWVWVWVWLCGSRQNVAPKNEASTRVTTRSTTSGIFVRDTDTTAQSYRTRMDAVCSSTTIDWYLHRPPNASKCIDKTYIERHNHQSIPVAPLSPPAKIVCALPSSPSPFGRWLA